MLCHEPNIPVASDRQGERIVFRQVETRMSVDLSIAGSGWSEKMEADPFPAIDGVLL
jgi:hypothetical protein